MTKATKKTKKTTGKRTKAKAARPAKPKRATGPGEASGFKAKKRLTMLDAAAQILKAASKPMRAKELIATMAERNLWTSPGGKTPHATLYAAMFREAREKGKASRFRKVDRGQFAFNKEAN